MAKFSDTTLAILAGGKATRMRGRNKALLEFQGETFINRIYRNLSPLFLNTVIISNDILDYNFSGAIVYPDKIQNIGPLGGIHSALVHSIDPAVFVVSCDMPFADSAIAKILIEEFVCKQPEILLPVINSFSEPLFAIYSKHLIEKIETLFSLSDGKPIKDLLKISNTLYFNLPESIATKKCFTNINSIEDFMKSCFIGDI